MAPWRSEHSESSDSVASARRVLTLATSPFSSGENAATVALVIEDGLGARCNEGLLGAECMQRDEAARSGQLDPGLIRRVLSGETAVGSVGVCGEFELHKKVAAGQGQGCLMRDLITGDVYVVAGLGGGSGYGYVEATTGGVILTSGSSPGRVPDVGTSLCADATAGAGIAVCGGLTSNVGHDLGSWAIEVFVEKVSGAAASGTGQGWISFDVPDELGAPIPSLDDALATLETAAR